MGFSDVPIDNWLVPCEKCGKDSDARLCGECRKSYPPPPHAPHHHPDCPMSWSCALPCECGVIKLLEKA